MCVVYGNSRVLFNAVTTKPSPGSPGSRSRGLIGPPQPVCVCADGSAPNLPSVYVGTYQRNHGPLIEGNQVPNIMVLRTGCWGTTGGHWLKDLDTRNGLDYLDMDLTPFCALDG